MKLILHFEEGYSEPVAWCEVCNTEITDAMMAMVYWRLEDYPRKLHAPLLTHKGCMSASRSLELEYICSMELSTYLAFLLHNVGLSGKNLRIAFENADLIASFQ